MKVHVKYERKDWEDYFAFAFTLPLYKKRVLKNFLLYAVAIAFVITLIQFLLTNIILYSLVWFLVITSVLFVSHYAMRQYYFRQWAEKYWKSATQKERSFELEPEGIRILDSDVNALVYWSKIKNIFHSNSHIFLEQNEEGFYQIPERAFPTPEAARVFFETARAFKSGVQPKAAWWTQGKAVTEEELRQRNSGGG